MKRLVTIAILAALVGGSAGVASAGELDPYLEMILSESADDEIVSTLVYLSDRVDLDALNEQLKRGRPTRQYRHLVVVTALQERAVATQGPLLHQLESLKTKGAVQDFHAYWITNCMRVDARPAAIKTIAARDDVETVYFNYPIELIEPEQTEIGEDPPAVRNPAPELGVQAVRAPEVWAMGITGNGILVSTLDTGVDGSHPALASRWRGVADPRYADHPEWAFFDPVTGWTFPQDSGSHGTHTMGTVCGGAPGNEVGVAPGAQWIHAAVIDRVSLAQTVADAILAFEWLTDPDGDPGTSWDVPQVCSNSWGIGSWHNIPPYNNPCDESFWSYLDACEAAGTVILFSAGNEGPSPNTLRRPADRATDDYRTCAVGGINANNPPNWTMYYYSSRGPTYCTPSGDPATKPDINAPAEGVVSSVPGGGYSAMSGTSMASPHVNGVVALILEACPVLTVEEVKQIMYDTALDLGDPGKDNDYGYGLVDAYEAVNLAMGMCSGAPIARDGYYETPVDTAVNITLNATDYDGLPDPPGAVTYIVTSLPQEGNTLTDIGNGYGITAGDLPYTLVDYGNQLTYTPTGGYYGTDTFEFKANDGGEPPDAGDSNIATVSVLVLFDPPEITTDWLPTGLIDTPYGPVQLEATGGQPELTWDVTGSFPSGLSLSSDGVISGTPTVDGSFNPTFHVTDSLGRSDQTQIPLQIEVGPSPPVAHDQNVSTEVNTPVTITLIADDEGLPEPPALTYIVLSLPSHGALSDAGAGDIDAVPYTLADGGNDVIYTPDAWYTGYDNFTFKANDGGEPPDGGDSNVAAIAVEIDPPPPVLVYSFPLDSDPGWTTEGGWAFGHPSDGGSHNGDPGSGHTGSNVYGYNLDGDYTNDMVARYLTTTAIDCSELQGVELHFWRWLGVESRNFDHATVEVSNDGSYWTTLWGNPLPSMSDTTWSQMTFDIWAVADGQPTLYVRWAMGPTDPSVTYPGWNIDDVEIWAAPPQCIGDLDGDDDIDLADLAQLLGNYGMTSGAEYSDGDLDLDGDVDLADLAALLAVYGTPC